MTFFLQIFSLLFIGSGLYQLQQHFEMIGKVTSAAELLNSTVLTAVFFIMMGIGLIQKKSWARLGCMGIFIVGMIAPFALAIYVGLHIQQFAMAFAMLTLFLQKLPVFLNNIFGYISMAVLSCLLFGYMSFIGYRQLASEDGAMYYNDAWWFERNFNWGSFDLRPAVFIVLFLCCSLMDRMLPRNFQAQLERKQFTQAAKDIKKELEKDPAYVKQVDDSKKYQAKKIADSQSALHLAFTQDETKIWAVTADSQVHLIDLRTYKNKFFPFGSFHQGRLQDLSPDGAYFYHPDKKVFVQTVDGREIPWRTEAMRFLGFAKPTQNALVFFKDKNQIALVNIQTKETLWSVDWTPADANNPLLNGIFWSADRNLAVLAPSGQFLILNLQTHKLETADFKFRYPEFHSSDLASGQMLLSGPVGFDQGPQKTYLLNTRTGSYSEVASEERIMAYDAVAGVFIAKSQNNVKFLKMSQPTEVVKELKASFEGPFLKLNGQPWVLNLEDQGTRVSFMNTERADRKPAGRSFTNDLPLETRVTRAAVSPSGAMSIVSVRNKFEVFWTSELAKEVPRTWAFDLEIAPSRR